MKKILAMILSFFMSLSTQTNYTMTEEKPYVASTYKVEDTALPDYRAYFGGGEKASATAGCNTNNYYSRGKLFGDCAGYWFVDGEVPTDFNNIMYHKKVETASGGAVQYKTVRDDKKGIRENPNDSRIKYVYLRKGTFEENQAIIMPYPGKLESSSSTTGLNNMIVTCSAPGKSHVFQISIKNMKYWYCDKDRKGDINFHTGDEQQGKSFAAGHVLGYATEDTTITIKAMENGKVLSRAKVTLDSFYTDGEFKKVKKKKK